MRATSALVLTAAVAFGLAACLPKDHPDVEWMKPPKSYDPVETEGLTFNKAGIDALTLTDGDERDAHITALQADGTFKGQAKCQSGAGTGDLEHSAWGDYELTCDAGTILFDIELKYHLFTSREVGKPLSANAYVEFGGTLVEFDYHDESKPRSITAKVKVGDDLKRLE
ncbi:hypothetical protein [Enhygromyxa salina]|uniref:Lipoprotein n=1 Tax=Enhygromyxa salina TaxID=215803 RepID=A0A2S9YRM5_9BACT|nr:hypothetical protein [Enhygromyxa salina]PRQ07728.1 hypothetical protein ENSA7_27180 [Enhygromyxa salina]